VEQLCGREGLKVAFREPPRQLGAGRLGGQGHALSPPLGILGRVSGHQLPNEIVHHAGAHRLERARGRLAFRDSAFRELAFWDSAFLDSAFLDSAFLDSAFLDSAFRRIVHTPMLFEHIFEYKSLRAGYETIGS
jgi:hypothetical protein